MKTMIILATLLGAANSFAGTIDIREADSISCQSESLGRFYLTNLKSRPVIISATTKNIVITAKKKNSIAFSYRDFKGYNFQLVLSKTVAHEDGSGHQYDAVAGTFINGDIESQVECVID